MMNANDAFVIQFSESQRMLELVMSDVTSEILAWTPSENVRPIGAQLGRAIPFKDTGWSMTVAQLLAVTIAHTTSHAGEIALLNGLQGARGLPF